MLSPFHIDILGMGFMKHCIEPLHMYYRFIMSFIYINTNVLLYVLLCRTLLIHCILHSKYSRRCGLGLPV
jgi:hypothetical protein